MTKSKHPCPACSIPLNIVTDPGGACLWCVNGKTCPGKEAQAGCVDKNEDAAFEKLKARIQAEQTATNQPKEICAQRS